MNLIIRDSRDEDVATLAGFYIASVKTETASWEYEPPDVAEFARRREAVCLSMAPASKNSEGDPLKQSGFISPMHGA